MNKIQRIKKYFEKIQNQESEYSKLSVEEMQDYENTRKDGNLVRMQIATYVLVAYQLFWLFCSIFSGIEGEKDWGYFLLRLISVTLLLGQRLLCYILTKRNLTSKRNYLDCIISWILAIIVIMSAFMIIESFHDNINYNFYIYMVILLIIPMVKIRWQILFIFVPIVVEVHLLIADNATYAAYRNLVSSTLILLVLSRLIYMFYSKNCILKLRLRDSRKELELMKNRLVIIKQFTGETIFEYSFLEDMMHIYGNEKTGNLVCYNFIDKMKHHYFPMDDEEAEQFVELYREIIYGKKADCIEFSKKLKDKSIIRYKAEFNVKYENNFPVRLTGRVKVLENKQEL